MLTFKSINTGSFLNALRLGWRGVVPRVFICDLGIVLANETMRYYVTPCRIGRAHTQNDPCLPTTARVSSFSQCLLYIQCEYWLKWQVLHGASGVNRRCDPVMYCVNGEQWLIGEEIKVFLDDDMSILIQELALYSLFS